MAKLRTVAGPLTGRVFELIGSSITVGRDLDNSLRLPVAEVSRHHAVLTLEGDVFALRDNGSTNGTFVNGQRVAETKLRPGDRIRFGPVEVRLEVEAEVTIQPKPLGAKPATAPIPVVSSTPGKTIIPALTSAEPAAPPASSPSPGPTRLGSPEAPPPEIRKPPAPLAPPARTAPAVPVPAGQNATAPIPPRPPPMFAPVAPRVPRIFPKPTGSPAAPATGGGSAATAPSAAVPPAATATSQPKTDAQQADGTAAASDQPNEPSDPEPERETGPPAQVRPELLLKKPLESQREEIKLRLGPKPTSPPAKTLPTPAQPVPKPAEARPVSPENRLPSPIAAATAKLNRPSVTPDQRLDDQHGAVAVLEPSVESGSGPDDELELARPALKLKAGAPPLPAAPIPKPPGVPGTSKPTATARRWVLGSVILLAGGSVMFYAGYPLAANALKFFGLILASAGFCGLLLAPWYARSRRQG